MEKIDFGSRTYIMGILNLTPDSFSGDGIYKDVARAMEEAEEFIEEGADILDVGGESTRPGSLPVAVKEEIERVVPFIERLRKSVKIPISIDTTKSEVAQRALDSGATIVNDISGGEFDSKMIDICARYDAGVIIMHIKGTPRSMQQNPLYYDLIKEIKERLQYLVNRAEEKGVKKENIIIDPGIGFGKTLEHNLEILNNLSEFKELGKPILVGPSRKSFIGGVLGVEVGERVFGTAASVAIAIKNGADIIRVHEVGQMRQVAKLTDAIIRSGEKINV